MLFLIILIIISLILGYFSLRKGYSDIKSKKSIKRVDPLTGLVLWLNPSVFGSMSILAGIMLFSIAITLLLVVFNVGY